MKAIRILAVAVLATLVLGSSACGTNQSAQEAAGQRYAQAIQQGENEEDTVVASYKDQTILSSVLEYQVEAQRDLAGDQDSITEQSVLEDILRNLILQDEAETRGLGATEEEIDQFLEETVYASYEVEEGKEQIDSYCASAGITFEDYVADVRRQAPQIIARSKLERAAAQDYCDAHGLTYDEMNLPQEVRDAVADYEDDLVKAHQSDITYYTP